MEPQPPRSIGGALVDVFDAALALVKTEIRLVARRVGNVVKAKGIGVVLLLAAAAPLSVALIFLILTVFFALDLFLQTWAAALIVALLALAVTGALVFLGISRLGAEVKDDTPAPGQLGAEDVSRAEKKLDKAEKDLEKGVERGEKKVDQAEKDLEQARAAASVGGVAPTVSSGAPSHVSTAPSGSTPMVVAPGANAGHATPAAPRRARDDEDGISVSTKPEFDSQEGTRRDR